MPPDTQNPRPLTPREKYEIIQGYDRMMAEATNKHNYAVLTLLGVMIVSISATLIVAMFLGLVK